MKRGEWFIVGALLLVTALNLPAAPFFSATTTQKMGTEAEIEAANLKKGELAIARDSGALYANVTSGRKSKFYPGGPWVSREAFDLYSTNHMLVVGPQGPQGEQGIQGIPGVGVDGATGPQGPAGTFSRPASFTNISTLAKGAIPKSLATEADQVAVSDGIGSWIAKTLAQFISWLGLKSSAFTESTEYANHTTFVNTSTASAAHRALTTTAHGGVVASDSTFGSYTGIWRKTGTNTLSRGATAAGTGATYTIVGARGVAPSVAVSGYQISDIAAGVKILTASDTTTGATPGAANITLGNNSIFNAATGTTGNLLDLQVNGSSKFSVAAGGGVTSAGNYSGGAYNATKAAPGTGNNSGAFYYQTTITDTNSHNLIRIAPTYNQASGTAANTDLLINRTETAIGSGTQRLISGQVGSVEKFGVDNTGFMTTKNRAIFGSNSSAKLAQSSTATAIFGTSTNNVTHEADGTLVMNGTATVWDDLRIEPTSRGGSASPSFAASVIVTTYPLYNYLFQNGDTAKYLYFNFQMPHGYKEGSQIYPHAHFLMRGNQTGVVSFTLACSIATPSTGIFSATPTALTLSYDVTADGTRQHFMATNGTGYTMTNMGVSTIGSCRIERDADTNTGDLELLYIDIHYEADTIASRTQTAK